MTLLLLMASNTPFKSADMVLKARAWEPMPTARVWNSVLKARAWEPTPTARAWAAVLKTRTPNALDD